MVKKRVPATLAGCWNTITERAPLGPSFEYWSTRRSEEVPSLAVTVILERVEVVSAVILFREARTILAASWAKTSAVIKNIKNKQNKRQIFFISISYITIYLKKEKITTNGVYQQL
jgi:hypothetical protein